MEVGELPITLLYNMDYTLNVSATNCAGHSDVLSITDIFVGTAMHNCLIIVGYMLWYVHNNYYITPSTDIYAANCSAPIITNPGVVVKPYNSTVEGTALYFKCDSGFLPNERRVAVCQSNGQWSIEISSKHRFMTLYYVMSYANPCMLDITCEQDIRYEVNQTLLTVTEREPLWNCEYVNEYTCMQPLLL